MSATPPSAAVRERAERLARCAEAVCARAGDPACLVLEDGTYLAGPCASVAGALRALDLGKQAVRVERHDRRLGVIVVVLHENGGVSTLVADGRARGVA